jgi:hypothetical protein
LAADDKHILQPTVFPVVVGVNRTEGKMVLQGDFFFPTDIVLPRLAITAQPIFQPRALVKPTKPGLAPRAVEVPIDFVGELSIPVDRKARARFEAADDYIKDEKWDYAVMLLQGMNDAKQDYLMPVLRDGSWAWVSRRTEANRCIGRLPEDGKKFYRGTYDGTARMELETGLQQGNWDLVARVATIYLHTTPGAVAAEIMATDYFDRGDFEAAAFYFDKLIDRDGLHNLKELTLVKAACAFSALPKNSDGDSRTFNAIMQQIAARCPNGVTVGDENVSLAKFKNMVAAFELHRVGLGHGARAEFSLKNGGQVITADGKALDEADVWKRIKAGDRVVVMDPKIREDNEADRTFRALLKDDTIILVGRLTREVMEVERAK